MYAFTSGVNTSQHNSKTSDRHGAAVASLWHFACALYGHAAVAEACIRAQDEYAIDINLALFAAWLAQRGEALTEGRARLAMDACALWRRDVIAPLRTRRRAWRDSAERRVDYEAIKALEIAAEREQLRRLACLSESEAWVRPCGEVAPGPGAARLPANLRRVARCHGVDPEALNALLAALRKANGEHGENDAVR